MIPADRLMTFDLYPKVTGNNLQSSVVYLHSKYEGRGRGNKPLRYLTQKVVKLRPTLTSR